MRNRITLSAAALEAPSSGEEQTQTGPKTVLKLPDPEQSKQAVLNSLTSEKRPSKGLLYLR